MLGDSQAREAWLHTAPPSITAEEAASAQARMLSGAVRFVARAARELAQQAKQDLLRDLACTAAAHV